MVMVGALAAVLGTGCGGAAAPAPEDPTPEQEPGPDAGPMVHWKIFYSSEVETLEEDGVTVGIAATATTLGPANVPDDVAESIAALLPDIEAADVTYRLSGEITGSGMTMEILSIDFEASSFDLRFEQGPQNEVPPEPVAKLYELVARKPLPSTLE
jgi:hypothetical protein